MAVYVYGYVITTTIKFYCTKFGLKTSKAKKKTESFQERPIRQKKNEERIQYVCMGFNNNKLLFYSHYILSICVRGKITCKRFKKKNRRETCV